MADLPPSENDRIERALGRLASLDEEGHDDAKLLRARVYDSNPVATLLSNSLDRQADSMQAISEAVPRAVGNVGARIERLEKAMTERIDRQEAAVTQLQTTMVKGVVVISVTAMILAVAVAGVRVVWDGKTLTADGAPAGPPLEVPTRIEPP